MELLRRIGEREAYRALYGCSRPLSRSPVEDVEGWRASCGLSVVRECQARSRLRVAAAFADRVSNVRPTKCVDAMSVALGACQVRVLSSPCLGKSVDVTFAALKA